MQTSIWFRSILVNSRSNSRIKKILEISRDDQNDQTNISEFPSHKNTFPNLEKIEKSFQTINLCQVQGQPIPATTIQSLSYPVLLINHVDRYLYAALMYSNKISKGISLYKGLYSALIGPLSYSTKIQNR